MRLSLILIICLSQAYLWSQQSNNPFEIRSAPKAVIQTTELDTPIVSFNPFELKASLHTNFTAIKQDNPIKKSLIPHWPLSKIQYSDVKKMLFWTLLFLSFLLALALNLNRSIVYNIYRSFTNINFFSLQLRDSNDANRMIYFILYGLYFIGLSIFIYLSYYYYIRLSHPYYLFVIALIICSIYSVRHIFTLLLGMIFKIEKEMYTLSYSIISYGCFMAIILIPADFIIAFVNPNVAQKLILIVCAFGILLFFIRQGRDILISSNLWKNSIIHFLLYLCTAEIAPLFLIYKISKIEGLFS